MERHWTRGLLPLFLSLMLGPSVGFSAEVSIGQPAPDFELPTLDGQQQVALADYRGQLVVLHFGAGW